MSSSDVVNITQLLLAAAGADAQARSQALTQLQELEARPGLSGLLLDAYADSAAPDQARYLAILTCKNVIDRRWQPRSGQSCSPEEKQFLKDKLLQLLARAISGELPRLQELSAVVRKVCRFDFPLQWEGLVHFLIAQVKECEQSIVSLRALHVAIVLHDVLKEQATKRLLGARKAFFQVSPHLLEPVGKFWMAVFTAMRNPACQEVRAGQEQLWKLSRHADASFFIMLTRGFPHLHEEPQGPSMVLLAKEKVDFLLQMLRQAPQLLSSCAFYVKNLKAGVKWWGLLLSLHPLAFAQADIATVLSQCVEILKEHQALRAGLNATAPWESLMQRCLEMLACAFCTHAFWEGPQPRHASENPELAQLMKRCYDQFQNFVQQQTIARLADLTCTVALQLHVDDLQAWLEEPESELQGPGSQTELRSAGENLIRSLAIKPFEPRIVEYVAKRCHDELAVVPTLNDSIEVIVRKDTLLALFTLLQAQLKGHLPFQQLMAIFMPVANLTPEMPANSMATLLVLRICLALKTWVDEIPNDAVLPVLQILLSFLQEGRPKAVRLAALAPVQAVFKKFSDHEAWAQMQSPTIDACLTLLSALQEPESQWRCLHLVQLCLCEEATSGGYEATDRSLQRMLALWRQPEGSELLICHALLDVMRALVLMSCWTRKPRAKLSAPLLSTCLTMISDCFTNLGRFGAPVSCPDSMSAALAADAAQAASSLGDRGGAASTVFDSGLLLFLAVLRVVELDQATQMLGLFPQLLGQAVSQPVDAMQDSTLEILLEFSVLHILSGFGGNASQLNEQLGLMVQLCRRCLETSTEQKNYEQSFRILQLVLACPLQPAVLQPALELAEKLLHVWIQAQAAGATALKYAPSLLVAVFCSWQNNHKQHFLERVKAAAPDTTRLATLLLSQSRSLRPLSMRVAALSTALALVESTGGSSGEFWQTFMQHCHDLVLLARKRNAGVPDLAVFLNAMRSKLSVPLPAPVRVNAELQCAVLPNSLHAGLRAADTPCKETVPVEWLFRHLAQLLQQLAAAQLVNASAVLAVASPEVQEAIRAMG
mmetsp:Transcript_64918/g.155056  ORF Transcript_64918/g.155056 Transcript_64918/m.155056 type:complete len:1054 (-) Transcript_64918:10-3171(-)